MGPKGYSRIGYAASAGSWMAYDRLVKEFSQNDAENLPANDPTPRRSALPKYEADDLPLNTKQVKRLGQIFGACDVGVANIDQKEHFVYSHNRN
ncbi:MAG: hypothetical protein ACFFCW_36430 [Candidatus Hodarchaeota archaeon]